jgi:predicted PurR-regulated permease PerM
MIPKRGTTSEPISGEAFYARSFALITIFILGFLLYKILLPFFAALAWSLFIAFLVHPLHAWLTKKLRGRQNISAALITFAILLVVVGPLAALGAAFGLQAADLLAFIRRYATEHPEFSDLAAIPLLGNALVWIQNVVGVSLAQIQTWSQEAAGNVLQPLAALGGKLFIGALGTVLGFVLMLFLLFFMIRDREDMLETLRALIPLSPAYKTRLFNHLGSVTRAIVYGSGVTTLVQGTMVGIGFAVVGLPSPIVFGVLAALCALVPMAGTPVVWLPAVIVLAVQQRWVAAGFLFAWGIVITTIDNVLRPWLVSGRAQVSALTVFIGVLGGASAFGAMGFFLGPLVLALVIALIRFTLDVRRSESQEEEVIGAQRRKSSRAKPI